MVHTVDTVSPTVSQTAVSHFFASTVLVQEEAALTGCASPVVDDFAVLDVANSFIKFEMDVTLVAGVEVGLDFAAQEDIVLAVVHD